MADMDTHSFATTASPPRSWSRRAALATLTATALGPRLHVDAQESAAPPYWFATSAEESFIVKEGNEKEILRYWRKKPAEAKTASDSAGYFHPFTTPSGVTLTDLAPDDHPHHRGIFFAWLEVRTAKEAGDFWGWGQPAPTKDRRIVNLPGHSRSEGRGRATFTTANEWKAGETTLLREELSVAVFIKPAGHVLDLEYTFHATEDTTLGQWAFSGFCVRLRKDGTLTLHDPDGEVTRPAPSHLDPASDWPDRPWYAAQLALKSGATIGAAVLNHPENPPTRWHNVAGISMLNPCVIAPGPLTIKGGEPLRLRYRVVAFDGAVPTAALDGLAADFAKPRRRRVIRSAR